MHRPWTRRDVLVVAGAQLGGLAVAFVGYWVAMFTLPAEGLFGEPNSPATRVVGAFAALGVALGVSSGCLAAHHRRRSPFAFVAGVALMSAVLVVAVGWAFQLDLG
jgi:hypothetical protein